MKLIHQVLLCKFILSLYAFSLLQLCNPFGHVIDKLIPISRYQIVPLLLNSLSHLCSSIRELLAGFNTLLHNPPNISIRLRYGVVCLYGRLINTGAPRCFGKAKSKQLCEQMYPIHCAGWVVEVEWIGALFWCGRHGCNDLFMTTVPRLIQPDVRA